MDTWSERDAGLGYIEETFFFVSFLLLLIFFFLPRFNVSFFGLVSYEYHFCLGLGPFCRAKMDVPLPSMLRKKEKHPLELIVHVCLLSVAL